MLGGRPMGFGEHKVGGCGRATRTAIRDWSQPHRVGDGDVPWLEFMALKHDAAEFGVGGRFQVVRGRVAHPPEDLGAVDTKKGGYLSGRR